MLRLMAAKKVFRQEIQAYTEARRRLAEVPPGEIALHRSFSELQARYPILLGFKGRLQHQDSDEESTSAVNGGEASHRPIMSTEYIKSSLEETMPDMASRVEHYMTKITRYMILDDTDNKELQQSVIRIQRAWRASNKREQQRVAETGMQMLTWSVFMLRLCTMEDGMQEHWLQMAHDTLTSLGIQTEEDVRRVFSAVKFTETQVKEFMKKAGLSKGWKTARKVMHVSRLGAIEDGKAAQPHPTLDLAAIAQSGNPIMEIAIAIVNYGRNASDRKNETGEPTEGETAAASALDDSTGVSPLYARPRHGSTKKAINRFRASRAMIMDTHARIGGKFGATGGMGGNEAGMNTLAGF